MIRMDELVEGARSGDRFFFHCTSFFSGGLYVLWAGLM